MAIIKCDKPMRKHKIKAVLGSSNYVTGSWRCDHNCEVCICALKKDTDGEWHHIKINNDGTTQQPTGRKKNG